MLKNLIKPSLLLFIIVLSFSANAERPKIKFGDVSAKDFEPKSYPIDPEANAIVLANFGSASYEGNSKGGFSIIYKKHMRIRILNRNGFDAATVSIRLFQLNSSIEEKIEKLEAFTYNISNGKVTETKLDNNSVFKDKVNKNFTVKKFTMPDLQEGCIIDVRYTVASPFERHLDEWNFQREIPVLWSEYAVSIPELYNFVSLFQGYHPFAINKRENSVENFIILDPGDAGQSSSTFDYKASVTTSTMAMENIPALKPENFTTTIANHIAKISFQLSKIIYPNSPVKNVMNNWFAASEELMKDPDFGEELTGSLNWAKSELKTIVGTTTSEVEAAKKIYEYIRNNFSCSNYYGYRKSSSLKKIFQSKNGSVADINLLLAAMLRAQGLEAHPVVLSTRENGKLYEAYPIMDRLNYVICNVVADGKKYLLDASHSRLGFGRLPAECYNGSGRLIHPTPVIVPLSADSLHEAKVTTLFFINDKDGKPTGTFTSHLGYQESYDLREKLAKTDQEEYLKSYTKGYSSEVSISNAAIEKLKDYEEPVAIKYDLALDFTEDIIYFNPLFSEATKENLFKAAVRTYPVEMPYALSETVIVTMDIPAGYMVDEIPKSVRVKYNEDEGMFEYLVSKNNGLIQLKSFIKLNKANFEPDDYDSLREFFGMIVKKHSEQIVLKKIKQ